MKKILLVLLIILTFSLVACSDNEDTRYQELEERIIILEEQILTYEEMEETLYDFADELEDYLGRNYYTQEELDEGFEDLIIAIQELQERTTFVFEFSDDYEYWLVIITSREPSDDFNYIYGVQELNDDTYTVYIESNDLFSIGELVLGVEIDNETLLLVDFEN